MHIYPWNLHEKKSDSMCYLYALSTKKSLPFLAEFMSHVVTIRSRAVPKNAFCVRVCVCVCVCV